ncbi:sigma-54-dependent Fis family transcriptional regulator [Clostridium sp. D2Q-14]|uniref:sigma-54-dependent transcriptional regulator n=1 Tax=Anaeromonas gelatinilytica TaxID=2683194 RepID=UPI00193B5211|nr:sigma-54 dependent transcriptional regulator [Anaeromonas gelatinilytica]MBS4535188.1 sigma-54-dependent Fis family transcriptional regulator [Anaeromonas gelatinilytica]
MSHNFKILIVDDEIEYQEVLKMILGDNGYYVKSVSSGLEALEVLNNEKFHLVLTDLIMDGINGIELLERIKGDYYDLDIILITGYGSIENAVDAMKKGAYSYFVKGEDPKKLLIEVKKLAKINAKNKFYKNESQENILLKTNNKEFLKIMKIARKVANSNVNVLITGESGVGKEILAKYIHKCSNRKKEKFVPVNCQSLPENLLESELFGHEKGSFTGAMEKRIGRFEESNGGTLFLDEIGEMPISLQVKLLRVIETKSIERVGSNKNIKIDSKLISATNRNIFEEIKCGNFREDLFYRINTITLEIPPLRDRREDINMFINFFLEKCKRDMKKNIIDIENKVMEFLLSYDYPGNIRELKNIIERLIVLSEDGIIKFKDLPSIRHERIYHESDNDTIKSLKEVRKEVEVEHIKKVIEKCNGNLTYTAKYLNISRRQLYNKVLEYNLK